MVDPAFCRLKLIDGFGLYLNDEELHVSRRKSQVLLSYLWLKESHTETRSRLSTLLWSRSGDAEARVSLRQELSRLNKELALKSGLLLLNGDKFAIWLSRSPPATDAELITSELEAGRIPAILLERTLLHEQFLSHFEGIDPELDLWISVQRTAFSRRCLRALSAIVLQRQGASLVKAAARALFNLDPSDESACRQLMEIAVAEDNIPEAIRLYKELRLLLSNNYGVKPSKALVDFVDALTQVKSPPIPSPGISATVQERGQGDARLLLLVHPVAFTHAATASTQRFAVLRNELIGALSRFRDWSVREFEAEDRRLASMQNADKVYEVVISGQTVGEADFLTVNLMSISTRTCLWSEHLQVDYMRFSGQQRDTIRKIAFALDIEISAHRLSRILGSNQSSLDVYDKWLLGQSLLINWRPKEEARAEALFRSVLAQSATFAPAISSLVQILNSRHHIFPGVMRNREREAESLTLARRASHMAPHDSRTQLTLAWSYMMNDDFDQAIHYFKLAVDINDNDLRTLISSAQGLCYAGEKTSSIELAERATMVGRGGDAMHWAYVACIQYHNDNYKDALKAIERSGDGAYFIFGMRAAILAQLGDEVATRTAALAFEKRIKEAWYGKDKPTQRNIRAWFSQIFPIRMLADRERLESGLNKAGFGLA
ncbi:BTAD domain-containing putative transcriptional regulator [Rhizobium herbae]|uniref:DNA-binding SARP family transcriptional activator/TPR repeat protein n=1 Tax=Rhizobium herbae TaxID=508661 RepID=A0ABS4EUC6_9HYPH|nr:BTAD domain-containing putative transcriptional regulator [Rhizobium herbae]MBP1861548.1 DNA-binding SARP family transcriptional activator/TPR repeat protein [Rhizobium herbae]